MGLLLGDEGVSGTHGRGVAAPDTRLTETTQKGENMAFKSGRIKAGEEITNFQEEVSISEPAGLTVTCYPDLKKFFSNIWTNGSCFVYP